MRQTVEDSEVAEQRLIVQVGVRRNMIGVPDVSVARLVIEPHALCYESGFNFSDDEDDTYNLWFETTHTQLHVWLIQQYTALTTPL